MTIFSWAEELEGVEGSQWNSERFIVFQAVVLQRTTDIRQASDIRQRVKRQIVDWRAGPYLMLVEDMTRTSRAMVLKMARGVSEEAISKTFTSIVLKGKIQTAVRFMTLRGAGGSSRLTTSMQRRNGRLSTCFGKSTRRRLSPTSKFLSTTASSRSSC